MDKSAFQVIFRPLAIMGLDKLCQVTKITDKTKDQVVGSSFLSVPVPLEVGQPLT